MSMGSIGEAMWRMLRRIELHDKAKQGVPYLEVRTWSRHDGWHIATLKKLGLVREVEADRYVLTPAGYDAAKFGEVEPAALTKARKELAEEEKKNLTVARKAAARIRKARV